ncbi:hypothetical protein SLEP1_g16851 [Rubroshorea leprosula]|uniref:Cytochrome P450 n=1 Tax=Rubroshorea leprosula TaxID=152421 RepID=A0AAV5J2R0_9ROSI|nr:hypothetical protein SLEP1_g16851 [Rubroshorea leprosula]
MDFLLSFSTTLTTGILAFLLFICSFLALSRRGNAQKKRMPPQAGGAWPIIGHLPLLGGPTPPHRILGEMADKYGPVFTIKLGVHRALIVSDSEVAKECLATNDKAFATRPKSVSMEVLGYNYAMFGSSPYGSYWRHARKIATVELLSNHRLEMFKHVRESEMKAWIKEIHHIWENNKDGSHNVSMEMKRWFGDLTLNKKGGLGVRDLRKYNSALLGKWWARFEDNSEGLWKKILNAKYYNERRGVVGAGNIRRRRLSKVWEDIVKLGNVGSEMGEIVGNAFVWEIGEDIKIGEMGEWCEGEWRWKTDWKRDLSRRAREDERLLLEQIAGVRIKKGIEDRRIWKHDGNGEYSIKKAYSIYMMINVCWKMTCAKQFRIILCLEEFPFLLGDCFWTDSQLKAI